MINEKYLKELLVEIFIASNALHKLMFSLKDFSKSSESKNELFQMIPKLKNLNDVENSIRYHLESLKSGAEEPSNVYKAFYSMSKELDSSKAVFNTTVQEICFHIAVSERE